MTKRKKIILWLLMLSSLPATYYAGVSVIYYSWLSASNPERRPAERAGLWSGSALILTILFIAIFIYCLVSLIKETNRKYREEQNKNET